MAAIQLRAIEKWFDDVQAIKGINFDINEGEFIVLVGPSGCGKSTLLRVLAGLEEATFGDAPGSNTNERGSITDIRLINRGGAYTKLPIVTSITTSGGSGANLKAVSNSGIGSIGSIEINNIGFNYSTAPTFNAQRHAVIEDISGTFVAGSNMTSHTGTISAFDSDRQLLSMTTNANLAVGNTVAAGGASGKIANIDTASLTAVVDTTATTVGDFLTEAGKISSDVMRIQDSFYYQDYSYVVKVGESIQ